MSFTFNRRLNQLFIGCGNFVTLEHLIKMMTFIFFPLLLLNILRIDVKWNRHYSVDFFLILQTVSRIVVSIKSFNRNCNVELIRVDSSIQRKIHEEITLLFTKSKVKTHSNFFPFSDFFLNLLKHTKTTKKFAGKIFILKAFSIFMKQKATQCLH